MATSTPIAPNIMPVPMSVFSATPIPAHTAEPSRQMVKGALLIAFHSLVKFGSSDFQIMAPCDAVEKGDTSDWDKHEQPVVRAFGKSVAVLLFRVSENPLEYRNTQTFVTLAKFTHGVLISVDSVF